MTRFFYEKEHPRNQPTNKNNQFYNHIQKKKKKKPEYSGILSKKCYGKFYCNTMVDRRLMCWEDVGACKF